MSVSVVSTGWPCLDVLHVDDDPLNLRVVHDVLQAFGHNSFQAASGAEALDQLSRRIFDVMLVDIHMPGMSGLELVERLRASVGPEQRMPVIALTADHLSRTRDQYLALGFQDFLTKPILVSRFSESLLRVTGRYRAMQNQRRAG